jgi:hypothetical protein
MKKMAPLLLCSVFLFLSCVGASVEIVARRDGSGTIALEYRVSRELESLGKLDGNENWPVIPVGKADLERSASRIEGLSLRSFSERSSGADLIYRARFDFANQEALVRFLDGAGQRASLVREGSENRLTLVFNHSAGSVKTDEKLQELLVPALEGYDLAFGITLPRSPRLRVVNRNGAPLESPPAGTALLQGNKVSFTAPMADILSAVEPSILEIAWQN